MRSTTILTGPVPFTARDGENLALYEWPWGAGFNEVGREAPSPQGVVLLVHGLGEHAGRYKHVAQQLVDWGFAVRAYDQRGHGESGGARGAIPDNDTLLEDLAEIIDDTRLRYPNLPLILLGHSLGGLVAGRFVALNISPVEGLIMSSPALDARLGFVQKLLLAVAPRWLPDLCVNNALDVRFLSHDERVVKAYTEDRLVHSRISTRLGKFIATAGPATVKAAASWRIPTLLLYAGADHLVNPRGSHTFAENAANSSAVKPGTVTVKCFKELYHELFNESRAASVFDALKAWLDAKF